MAILNNSIYHIYNQGNNKEIIFKEHDDYLRFLEKISFLVKPNCDFLTYCLMPNHFHFLIQTTSKSVMTFKSGSLELNKLTNSLRLLLSEYAQEFNKKYKRSGSLFRQKTKFKIVDYSDPMYLKNVFKYVLSNPIEAKLVSNLDDWPYSSFLDLIGKRQGKLCDLKTCYSIFQANLEDLKDIGSGYDDILYLKN